MDDFGIASSESLGILSIEWWMKRNPVLQLTSIVLSFGMDSNQNIRVNISLVSENFIARSWPKNHWFLVFEYEKTAPNGLISVVNYSSLIHPDIHPGSLWTLNTPNHTENKGALKQNTFFSFQMLGLLWIYVEFQRGAYCVQTFF